MHPYRCFTSCRIVVLFTALLMALLMGLSVPLYSQQMSFNRIKQGNSYQYIYDINNSFNKTAFSISFILPSQEIRSAFTMIPSLNALKKEMKPELELAANKLLAQYSLSLNTTLKQEINKINQKGKITEYYSYSVSCEKENPVEFAFNYHVSGEYSYRSNINGCSIASNTKNAWKVKLAQIEKVVNASNQELEHGSKIILKSDSEGYKLGAEISAPSQQEADRMNSIIDDAVAKINSIESVFDEDYAKLQKELEATNKYIDKLFKRYQERVGELEKKLSDEFRKVQDKKFEQYYFKVERDENVANIVLDYKKLIIESVNAVKPISTALQDTSLSTREQIQKVLTFLQTIPYNRLLGREVEGYSGFLPPLGLIDKNKGDCDTKAVMFLALMKNLFPEINTVLIIIPEHAFVGIEIPAIESDKTIPFNNKQFVVAEPVGPGLFALGTDGSEDNDSYNTIEEVIPIFDENI